MYKNIKEVQEAFNLSKENLKRMDQLEDIMYKLIDVIKHKGLADKVKNKAVMTNGQVTIDMLIEVLKEN